MKSILKASAFALLFCFAASLQAQQISQNSDQKIEKKDLTKVYAKESPKQEKPVEVKNTEAKIDVSAKPAKVLAKTAKTEKIAEPFVKPAAILPVKLNDSARQKAKK